MLTWLAIIPIASGSLLLIPVLADAPRATLTAAAAAIVPLWAAWI